VFEVMLNEYDSHVGYTDNYQSDDVLTTDGVKEPGNGRDIDKGIPHDTKKPWANPDKKAKPFDKGTKNECGDANAAPIEEQTTAEYGAKRRMKGVKSPVPNTSIKIGVDRYLEYQQVGHPINSFYVFQQAYDENGKPVENAVVDRNADGLITQADRYFYKSPMAPITMGLSSRLEYKNWDFGFSLRASIGNYVYNNNEQGMANVNPTEVWKSSLLYMNNYTYEAINRNWQTYEITSQLSDFYVHNASFLKCDNITLGYSFNRLFAAGNFKGLNGRVYGTVSNVFTITNYDGLDPEVGNGFDSNMYPRPISFIFGLNLNL
jgi:iron complex outermembrane receptor protein